MKNLIDKIKKSRRIIDTILENNEVLDGNEWIASFEFSLDKTRMWMGKLLSYLGEANPYAAKDGSRKTVADILPEADKGEQKDIPACILVAGEIDYVELIDRLRTECSRIEKVITQTDLPTELFINQTQAFYAHLTIQQCWENIVEAKMWLGKELGRIRDENEKV